MSELEQPMLFEDPLLERQRRHAAWEAELDAKGVIHCNGWTVEGSVGPGWKNLVEPLLRLCRLAGVEVMQVKEKFGTLRFYTGAAPEWVQSLIDLAEAASGNTCEECGAHKNYGWYRGEEEVERGKTVRVRTDGWLKNLCDPCAVKAGRSIKQEEDK